MNQAVIKQIGYLDVTVQAMGHELEALRRKVLFPEDNPVESVAEAFENLQSRWPDLQAYPKKLLEAMGAGKLKIIDSEK